MLLRSISSSFIRTSFALEALRLSNNTVKTLKASKAVVPDLQTGAEGRARGYGRRPLYRRGLRPGPRHGGSSLKDFQSSIESLEF